jgi:hypothetical protein
VVSEATAGYGFGLTQIVELNAWQRLGIVMMPALVGAAGNCSGRGVDVGFESFQIPRTLPCQWPPHGATELLWNPNVYDC